MEISINDTLNKTILTNITYWLFTEKQPTCILLARMNFIGALVDVFYM